MLTAQSNVVYKYVVLIAGFVCCLCTTLSSKYTAVISLYEGAATSFSRDLGH